ncbi:MAG: response regulator [Plectolyngbya sp. WJT66-NPBG17]|jgi:PAS domain S-box-containing protein|nr:response regulator [Plectolyngbya sp. WJT66-NPBG17]
MDRNGYKGDILIVDDTPENLTLLTEMLKQEGYKVRSVTKGSTALRGAQAAPPDVILLDVNMPEMNGYEVCQQLKLHDRTHDIPVIFISALGDVLDKVKAFEVGGVDYITKPFQIAEVKARITTHLTVCRLQQQMQAQNLQLQAEIRERQQAEDKFAKVFRTSPHPIAITTHSEGRFVEANPAFLQLTGYTQSQIVGLTVTDLNLDIDLNSQTIYNQECELRTKSGEKRTVLLSLENVELDGVPCILNLVNDITQRKRLENEFIAVVSHELRTPLSSLMGALDVLGTGQLGSLNNQGQSVLNIAITSTERLTRLINDILDLERLKFGKITLHLAQCDLAQAMIQATEVMQAMADQAQVQLQLQPLSVMLWADCDRLIQTFTNLLSNAIKFSEPGKTVWLDAEMKSPDSVLLTVRDQGRGIPADKLDLIFDQFQQVDTSDNRAKGGTGLGLAICRSIVEQHQGKIWVESTLGQGSTFFVALPLALPDESYE